MCGRQIAGECEATVLPGFQIVNLKFGFVMRYTRFPLGKCRLWFIIVQSSL